MASSSSATVDTTIEKMKNVTLNSEKIVSAAFEDTRSEKMENVTLNSEKIVSDTRSEKMENVTLNSEKIVFDTRSEKMVTLTCSDEVCVQVEEKVIVQSETIKGMIEDKCTEDGVPIPIINVSSKIMASVIEYLKKHVDDDDDDDDEKKKKKKEELKEWDKEYADKLSMPDIFDAVAAANYLNIKNLLDFLCQTIADGIKDKKVDEIGEIFGIVNDFTPQELEAYQKDNQWAFQ